jgi:xanthine dehydrogenase accessory factor
MLVAPEGRVIGTIGGGAVEYESERLALLTLKDAASSVRSFDLTPNQVADLGMVCGGAVTVYFQYIDPSRKEISALCDYALAKIRNGEACWLITELTEGRDGRLSVYSEADGYYNLDNPPDELLALMTNHAVMKNLSGREFYVEQLGHTGRVYIFGGGHVAQELVPVLAHVDFRCVVLDDRPDFTRQELFPGAMRVLPVDFSDFAKTITVTEEDYIVIMTRGHQHDSTVQAQAMRTEACYIGVMGSRHKIAAVRKQLSELGFTDRDFERIKTPIGLDIKAETPAEIAISICGELIQMRAERAGL